MGGSHSPSIETPATCQIKQTLCPCDESNNQSDVYGLFSLYDFEFINAFISAFVGNSYGIFADFRQGFAYFVFDSFSVLCSRKGYLIISALAFPLSFRICFDFANISLEIMGILLFST